MIFRYGVHVSTTKVINMRSCQCLPVKSLRRALRSDILTYQQYGGKSDEIYPPTFMYQDPVGRCLTEEVVALVLPARSKSGTGPLLSFEAGQSWPMHGSSGCNFHGIAIQMTPLSSRCALQLLANPLAFAGNCTAVNLQL